MRRTVLLALLLTLAGPVVPAEAHPPPSAGGFEFPESVWWDGETGSFYVTNWGGTTINPGGEDPDGYLSQLSGEGRVVAAKWVTGLRSPKGMRRVGDALYVADVGQVVVIDVARAAIRSTIDLEAIGAQFPNDVALDDESGDVYVSDMLRNAIYRLPGGSGPPEVFVESADLESPNGLLVDGGSLLVASFGRDLDPATFRARQPGRVLVVDLATKAIAPLGGMSPTAQLDGIEKLDDSYLVTDNPGGKLIRIGPEGSVTELAGDIPGAADLGLRTGDRVAAIPQLRDGVVRFIEVP
ncbi:MAG: ATP/GTP-binding protein [Actinomycetota bacterium]|nr:ATP/GTP-binding protein [Actinomycetota bacterium]